MSNAWNDLIREYAQTTIKTPGLKIVTLAQWALESNFGKSDLAKKHNNYAGLKFRARVNKGRENDPLAFPVDYEAHDGLDTYCMFTSMPNFIIGYWAFVANGSMYDGWEDFADDPGGYVQHLHDNGYAGDPDYVSKVMNLMPRIRRQVMDLGLGDAFDEDMEPDRRTPVAILIGHNSKAKGAFSPHLDVSEWTYNQRVFKAMKAGEAEYGLELRQFFRQRNPNGYSAEIKAAYADIDAWDPTVIVELHFNSGGGRGSEMLFLKGSKNGKKLAKAVQASVVEELGMKNRGAKARTRSQRGGSSLIAARAPTILTEPFFGDSRKDCQIMTTEGHAALARAYLIGIRDALAQIS